MFEFVRVCWCDARDHGHGQPVSETRGVRVWGGTGTGTLSNVEQSIALHAPLQPGCAVVGRRWYGMYLCPALRITDCTGSRDDACLRGIEEGARGCANVERSTAGEPELV